MLLRKNIMIEKNTWEALELLNDIKKTKDKKISISKIANEAIRMYLDKEKENNLAFKMQMLSKPIDSDEEEEILKELTKMSKQDLKITKTVEI